jgi:hypothetical protein
MTHRTTTPGRGRRGRPSWVGRARPREGFGGKRRSARRARNGGVSGPSSVVRRPSSVVRRPSCVVRRPSFVVRRSSFVVRRSLLVVCCPVRSLWRHSRRSYAEAQRSPRRAVSAGLNAPTWPDTAFRRNRIRRSVTRRPKSQGGTRGTDNPVRLLCLFAAMSPQCPPLPCHLRRRIGGRLYAVMAPNPRGPRGFRRGARSLSLRSFGPSQGSGKILRCAQDDRGWRPPVFGLRPRASLRGYVAERGRSADYAHSADMEAGAGDVGCSLPVTHRRGARRFSVRW